MCTESKDYTYTLLFVILPSRPYKWYTIEKTFYGFFSAIIKSDIFKKKKNVEMIWE